MTTQQKILAFCKHNGIKSSNLATAAGIDSGNMSRIMNSGKGLTVHNVVPLAAFMGVTIDWLYDDEASWPPVKRGDLGRHLSAAEERILTLARELSEDDADPSELKTARNRLLAKVEGVDTSVAMPPLRPKHDQDNHGTARETGNRRKA